MAAILSGLATSLGALPFLFVRNLARRTYDGILGLGAGLMLAAATLGLLAEAVRGVHEAGGLDVTRLTLVIAGFVVGVGIAAAIFGQPQYFRLSLIGSVLLVGVFNAIVATPVIYAVRWALGPVAVHGGLHA